MANSPYQLYPPRAVDTPCHFGSSASAKLMLSVALDGASVSEYSSELFPLLVLFAYLGKSVDRYFILEDLIRGTSRGIIYYRVS